MHCPKDWPEPIVRVQCLSDSGARTIPDKYVKPPESRPSLLAAASSFATANTNIPLIDLGGLDDDSLRGSIMGQVSDACREWGFFQVVNHGVPPELMDLTREAWRGFFHAPMGAKQRYANSPATYEGYGSRLGVETGAILDWSDYFFLHYMPCNLRDLNNWPHFPTSLRYFDSYIGYYHL